MPAIKTNVRTIINSQILWLTHWFWKVAPNWSLRKIAPFYFSPPKIKTTSDELYRKEGAQSIFIPELEQSISVWSIGAGPAVMCIHGWGGNAAQMYGFAQALTQAGYQAILYDNPAHGNSTEKISNLFEFIAVAKQLQKRFQPKALVAHSMGAIAATAISQPELIPLVLVAPISDFKAQTFPFTQKQGLHPEVQEALLAQIEERHQMNITALSPLSIASTIENPVLILHDPKDKAAAYDFSEQLAGRLPHATLLQKKGLGHNRILEDQGTQSASIQFLQKHL